MKKLLTFLSVLCIFGVAMNNIFAQKDSCLTVPDTCYLPLFPVASLVTISTMGWGYDSTSSTELDFLPDNGWHIHDGYSNNNADNGFSDSTAYWELNNGILNLYLKNDTFITQEIPPDTFLYTAAILKNDDIDMTYGYYEVKVKLPFDVNLCTSFWGITGYSGTLGYREIDEFEYFTKNLHSNIYHINAQYGGQMYIDTANIDSTHWYIFGLEWLPKKYNLFVNNHFIEDLDYDEDCVEDYLAPIDHWLLWIVNWVNKEAQPPFPKVLQCDYIRIYNLNYDNINFDFYDDWSNYDYRVWHTVRLGNAYNAVINDNGSHSVWATDGITLDKGFEVAKGTEFTTKIYKQ